MWILCSCLVSFYYQQISLGNESVDLNTGLVLLRCHSETESIFKLQIFIEQSQIFCQLNVCKFLENVLFFETQANKVTRAKFK